MGALENALIRIIDEKVDKRIDQRIDKKIKSAIASARAYGMADGILTGISVERERIKKCFIKTGMSPDDFDKYTEN